FVRRRGEEFVSNSQRLGESLLNCLQFTLRLLLARYVASNFGCSHNRSISIVDGRNRQRDIQPPPILGQPNRLEVIDFPTTPNPSKDKIFLYLPFWRDDHPD